MKLFLTGATGFIGRQLLDAVAADGFESILCLVRGGVIRQPAGAVTPVEPVVGDLLDVASYSPALARADTVVHLAAATGNASARKHFQINAEATEKLIEQCRRHGVRRFLYVSSIAASFADTRRYPYAQSKQRAEAAVRASGMAYTIVRPTMVFGRGSPVGVKLHSMAQRQLIPLPGSGHVRVQPIDVVDLASVLRSILVTDRFANETFEIGGPEILTMRALLSRMHAASQTVPPRIISFPIAPLVWALSIAEHLPIRLPVTAGQLSSFSNDSVATSNALAFDRSQMRSLDATLETLAQHE